MKRIAIAGLAVALVALAFIGGGIGLAAAQGEDEPVQTFLGRVAEKLGIGEDELRSAISEVEGEIVDEKVAEGLLTPDQGERLKERIEEGNPLGPRAFHRIGEGGRHHYPWLLPLHSLATVLGIEPQDLVSELKEGKTPAQLAEEQGMTRDELTAALLDEARGKLDEQIADGNLTETQADAIFESVENNIDRFVDGVWCHVIQDGRGLRFRAGGPIFHGPGGAFFGGGLPGADIESTETAVQA